VCVCLCVFVCVCVVVVVALMHKRARENTRRPPQLLQPKDSVGRTRRITSKSCNMNDRNNKHCHTIGGHSVLNHRVDRLAIRVDEAEVVSDRVQTPQNRVLGHTLRRILARNPFAGPLLGLDFILLWQSCVR
jgi:hypothetical protein